MTSDIGWYAFIPITLMLICNSIFSNKLIYKFWKNINPLGMKLVYNIVDLIYEYTAICLANFSARIANLNVAFAFIVSILLG